MHTPTARVLAFPAPDSSPAFDLADPAEAPLLGMSEAITRVRAQIARVAPYFRAATLCGEAGTGFEAAARALHRRSTAKDGDQPFMVLPPEAAERYVAQYIANRSAPATQLRGTLFFTAIDTLSLAAQRALLRRLRQRPHVFRLVATSQTDLKAAVSAGRFSVDLADALCAIRISLPALRDRKDDLPALAVSAVQRTAVVAGVPPPVLDFSLLQALSAHSWPGNLDELEAVLASLPQPPASGSLTAADLQQALERTEADRALNSKSHPRLMRLGDVVQEHIRGVLMACHGNKLRAADVLGISRSTLYRMLDSYTPARLPLAG